MKFEYIVLAITLIIIAIAIIRSKHKDFNIEANKLVEYLGGMENIIEYEDTKSRFVVKLKNIEIVNKEAIQKMGAQGIVEIDDQLKIILGNNAKQLNKYIKDIRK